MLRHWHTLTFLRNISLKNKSNLTLDSHTGLTLKSTRVKVPCMTHPATPITPDSHSLYHQTGGVTNFATHGR